MIGAQNSDAAIADIYRAGLTIMRVLTLIVIAAQIAWSQKEVHMTTNRYFAAFALIGLFTAGCVTVALAPGAEKVKITKNASDVAACKAVGNVRAPLQGTEAVNATLQNQTLGLGGNTVFVTGPEAQAVGGVAYNCP